MGEGVSTDDFLLEVFDSVVEWSLVEPGKYPIIY
jgi:hypothetical protein